MKKPNIKKDVESITTKESKKPKKPFLVLYLRKFNVNGNDKDACLMLKDNYTREEIGKMGQRLFEIVVNGGTGLL